jgi:transposase
MLQLVPQLKILLCVAPIDFRKGMDGLKGICKQELKKDPFSGQMFVFTNRRKVGVKILIYDGTGFWLCYKRFSQGKLKWWPKSSDEMYSSIEAYELQVLLMNGVLSKLGYEHFKKVSF